MEIKKTIVIAGSKGFFGNNLISYLEKRQGFNIVKIDIEDGLDLSSSNIMDKINKFDYFVHFANISFVPDSFLMPQNFYHTNFETTLNALELCRKYRAKMIYISSYVYGNPKYLPVDEEHEISPFNPYAQSKAICEKLCEGYNRDFNIDITIFRPFNLYGFKQKTLIIAEIIEKIKNGEKLIQLQNSKPRRDYVNIKDAVNALYLAICSNLIGYNVFNIASNTSHSVKEITALFERHLQDKSIKFIFNDNHIRRNEVLETRGSYDLAKKMIGWEPVISFDDGLKELLVKENL
jgi:nucleoside-diphosphate-sugar epimerase